MSTLLRKLYNYSHLKVRQQCLYKAIAKPRKVAYSSCAPIQVSYQEFKGASASQKLPIIILHGLFGAKGNWRSLAKSISSRTSSTTYALDARNHGQSPHTKEFDYNLLASDVGLFLKEKDIRECILIGHSMGGRQAMTFAHQYPTVVSKLVVVDISPIRAPSQSKDEIPKFMAIMEESIEQLTTAMSLAESRKFILNQLEKATENKSIREFLVSNLYEDEDKTKRWRFNLSSLSKNHQHILGALTFPNNSYSGPTCFICGGDSPFVPASDHEKIKQIFPQAVFHSISGAGHWVHADKPAEFVDVLCSFLQS